MDSTDNKRGFSGLSDLVSDISCIEDYAESKQSAEPTSSSVSKTISNSSVHEESAITQDSELEYSNKYAKNTWDSGAKWAFYAIATVFLAIIILSSVNTKNPGYNQPTKTPNSSNLQNITASVIQDQRAELQYTKPSIGANNVLSVQEIRWCIRDGIRIEAMRDVIDNNTGIDEFNRIVNDHNSRCGSYRYRQGSQSLAERDVEPYRSQIVAEAISDARQMGRSNQPSYPSISPNASTNSTPKKPNAQDTREAQQLLTDLGYDPGPADGDYGRRTVDAVKVFQRDAGFTQDGWIDENLLSALRRAKATNKTPVVSQPKPQSQTSTQSHSSAQSTPSASTAGHFTRGSHQDEVLRIQGRPDGINDYAALGYREWKYGYSSVKLSSRNGRVLSWNNEGNLKVRLTPGNNVTSSTFYTRGSHQDDVLRIQGTPDDINDYSALGYEEWRYGYSSIKLSSHDRKVQSWTNQGNLKVRLSPGSNTTSSQYFTRNSHQDDVLRLQGTPDDINDYSALGYEEWKYGYSSVKISTRDRRVMGWDNSSSNLKSR